MVVAPSFKWCSTSDFPSGENAIASIIHMSVTGCRYWPPSDHAPTSHTDVSPFMLVANHLPSGENETAVAFMRAPSELVSFATI